ncbi:MAG TPA: hypothetical protein PKX87_05405, partial [Alphaproteobacteria bacterium]|nr:hypothetical protein [Alphaproteobacteria bacterium]
MAKPVLKDNFTSAVLTMGLLTFGGVLGGAVYAIGETFDMKEELEKTRVRLEETNQKLERLEQALH